MKLGTRKLYFKNEEYEDVYEAIVSPYALYVAICERGKLSLTQEKDIVNLPNNLSMSYFYQAIILPIPKFTV